MEENKVTEEVLENPEVKKLLETYTTIMMHKDLVDLITQYSIVKGRGTWEEEFEKLMQDEIKKANGVKESNSEENKNVQKFKI